MKAFKFEAGVNGTTINPVIPLRDVLKNCFTAISRYFNTAG